MVQQRLCLVLSTMTVLQGPEAVSSLLGDALRWAEKVTLSHQQPSAAEACIWVLPGVSSACCPG